MTEIISIKPVIVSNKIRKIEVESVSLPLKEELSVDELPQLIQAVEAFFKYVDIGRFGGSQTEKGEDLKQWAEEKLQKFVSTQLRDGQKDALKVMLDSREIEREDFVKKMKEITGNSKFEGHDLGGLLAGITMKSKSLGYERPFTMEFRTERDEDMCYYYLIPEYKNAIEKALKEQE